MEPGASIGSGTKIWHHCHIREFADVGTNCSLGKNVFVDSEVIIGNSVKIQNNVSVYKGVVLEDEVFVGPSAVFTNDRTPRAASSDWEVSGTLVRRGASVGANATVIAGLTIGFWAMVGAGSVVTRDVQPHELVVGNPARRAGWVCRSGHVVLRGDRPLTKVICEDCGARVPEDS